MSNLLVKHSRSFSPVKLRVREMPAVVKRRTCYKDEKLARNALLQRRREDQKPRAGVRYQTKCFANPPDCRSSLIDTELGMIWLRGANEPCLKFSARNDVAD